MQKGERSAGLRCCHPSRVNDEDWIDLPSSFLLFLLANFPSKNKTILFPLLLQSFFHEELHFCFNSSLSSLFLDIPDSIESNAHNLALDGGGSDSGTNVPTRKRFLQKRWFFSELSFLLRVDKNGLEGCNSGWNFPWWWWSWGLLLPIPPSKSYWHSLKNRFHVASEVSYGFFIAKMKNSSVVILWKSKKKSLQQNLGLLRYFLVLRHETCS